jgi:rhamnulokinase
LVGTETQTPVIDAHSLRWNFTNEAGASGQFRLLKNVAGMWLVQECRRYWEAHGSAFDYPELIQMAAVAKPLYAFIHPNDPRFLSPGDMPGRISQCCRETGQLTPESPGEVVRCILESLALAYRGVIEHLENHFGRKVEVIHILGGGSQNTLLTQMTADATGKLVIAGPVVATAIGNIAVQLVALGALSNLEQGREVIRRSFELHSYEPAQTNNWDEAYHRWRELWGDIG